VAGSAPRCREDPGFATSLPGKKPRAAGNHSFQPGPGKPGPEHLAPRLRRDLASAPLRMCMGRTLRARGANGNPSSGSLARAAGPGPVSMATSSTHLCDLLACEVLKGTFAFPWTDRSSELPGRWGDTSSWKELLEIEDPCQLLRKNFRP
jgi:hypothetical protein